MPAEEEVWQDSGEVGHCRKNGKDAYKSIERHRRPDIDLTDNSARANNNEGCIEGVSESSGAWKALLTKGDKGTGVVTSHRPQHTSCRDVRTRNYYNVVDEEDNKNSHCGTGVARCLVVYCGKGKFH